MTQTPPHLINNQITEIKNIDNPVNLSYLFVNNQITEIKNLYNLINLSHLYLNNNQKEIVGKYTKSAKY